MDIELRHIHKRFGRIHANNDINVTLKGGCLIGVLGENGAGKSTLMKILSGFQPADSGEILIDGHVVDYHGPQAAISHGIGMLQQDPLDVPAFTVLENFMFGAPSAWTKRVGREKLREISQKFGFALDPETPMAHLSIAQRQQLEIVRLLALGVTVLILDEPTTGISADQKTLLFDALKILARDEGMTVLLVSHKLEDVIAVCNQMVVLRAGRVVDAKPTPTSTQEIVQLMFAGELQPLERESVPLGAPVMALENLDLRAGRLAIENLSLNVQAGEVIGLAGLDGSGQEMLMRACVGLLRPHEGHVYVNDVNLTGKTYRTYLQSGVVFGAAGRLEEGLIAGMTLTEHVALVKEMDMIIDWDEARHHCELQIDLYKVRGVASDTIEQLSGGNQQRVLMALMPPHPLCMVLEQPTRGLDVDSARWIWQQLLARRANGTSIIFSSAELDEIVNYSDRILVFYAGQVHEVPDASKTSIEALGHMIGGDFAASARGEAVAHA